MNVKVRIGKEMPRRKPIKEEKIIIVIFLALSDLENMEMYVITEAERKAGRI